MTKMHCTSGLCSEGRRPCPTPYSCNVPAAEDEHADDAGSAWEWLTARRFWWLYAVGLVGCGVLGWHFWSRL